MPPLFIGMMVPVPIHIAALRLGLFHFLRRQNARLYGRDLYVLTDRRAEEGKEPGVREHFHSGVILLQEMERVDIKVNPPLPAAGRVVFPVFRDALSLHLAFLPPASRTFLRGCERGVYLLQFITPQHISDHDEAVFFECSHLILEESRCFPSICTRYRLRLYRHIVTSRGRTY